jgi:hypothetical protein
MILPVTSQQSDTHGLSLDTRVPSVPAPTGIPRASMVRIGGAGAAICWPYRSMKYSPLKGHPVLDGDAAAQVLHALEAALGDGLGMVDEPVEALEGHLAVDCFISVPALAWACELLASHAEESRPRPPSLRISRMPCVSDLPASSRPSTMAVWVCRRGCRPRPDILDTSAH